ncbi:hypothetical protein V8B97DRAFT_1491331 [Scleroderma yunnanense]
MILHCSGLWTFIRVMPEWNMSFVKAHVAGSSQSLLELEICSWEDEKSRGTLHPLLNVPISCAHRRRSLNRDVDQTYLDELLKRMHHTIYPSLTHLSLDYDPRFFHGRSMVPQFCTSCYPRLKHLDLRGIVVEPDLSGLQQRPNLTSLSIECSRWSTSSFRGLPTQVNVALPHLVW